VENIERQVKELTSEELRRLGAELWDRQFESDGQNGKLDKTAAKALHDYKEGRATEL
jgi:hypothetical protein